jgi:hypothetical protein
MLVKAVAVVVAIRRFLDFEPPERSRHRQYDIGAGIGTAGV